MTTVTWMSEIGLGCVKTLGAEGDSATLRQGACILRVRLCADPRDERLDAYYVHHASNVVGQHVECHFGGDLRQALHQEVRRPHSHFQRAKWMLDRLATLAHGLRIVVEALLYGLQHMLMLPARDSPLRAGRAARLEHTVTACICPIASQALVALLVCVMVLQLFAGRTAIHILVAAIDKV